MLFKIIIWHWNEKLYDELVQYDNQQLADAFTMGLHHAYTKMGKKPTGMQTQPIK